MDSSITILCILYTYAFGAKHQTVVMCSVKLNTPSVTNKVIHDLWTL
jgi:hypothetical protein